LCAPVAGSRCDPHACAVTRIGLVLGAGGVVGQAYHAGVLAALEHDYGWDPRSAEVIVGTSAGSITGALLRSGVPASELAAWTVKSPLAPEGTVLREVFGSEHPKFEPYRPERLLLRPPAIPELSALKKAVLRPWQIRPLAAALAVIPPGRLDGADTFASLAQLSGPSWPEQELWICAVRVSDGRRVVFGRDETEVPLSTAVASSCAAPGYFKPIQINGESFVDGVVHSPTNATVLRDRPLDLILVLSPMSGPGWPIGPYGLARRHAGWLARREVTALRRSDTPVLSFRPGHREQQAMGTDVMSADRLHEIVQESFLAAGPFAAARDLRQLLNGRAA